MVKIILLILDSFQLKCVLICGDAWRLLVMVKFLLDYFPAVQDFYCDAIELSDANLCFSRIERDEGIDQIFQMIKGYIYQRINFVHTVYTY